MNMDFATQNEKFKQDCRDFGWLQILGSLTSLTRSIDSFTKTGSKKGDFCPMHGGKKGDKFLLLPSAEYDGAGYCLKCKETLDGFGIIMEERGINFAEAARLVKDLIYPNGKQPHLSHSQSAVSKPLPKKSTVSPAEIAWEQKRAKQIKDQNNELWNNSFGVNHEMSKPLRDYFLSRAITNWGELGNNVRFHPSVRFVEKVESPDFLNDVALRDRQAKLEYLRNHRFYRSERKNKDGDIFCDMGEHPAALFIMRDNNTLAATSIQRVFLSEQGMKMELDGCHGITVKKRTPAIPGVSSKSASCHIDPPSMRVIGVAEGPETTLAIRGATKLPMNCCVDAGGLGNWEPTAHTDVVFIFEDKDLSRTGHKAALKLQERLKEQFIEAIIISPPMELKDGQKSVDWQDCIQLFGLSSIPEFVREWDTRF